MRIYNVTLAADEHEFAMNEELDPLKRRYDEYLMSQVLTHEDDLIDLLRSGRVKSVEYVGVLK